MNEKVLNTLEYNKIIQNLTEFADSEPGKKVCTELVPSTDLEEIRKNQKETADALSRLFKLGSTSFGGNKDIGFTVKTLDIGSTLSSIELLKIAKLLDNVNRIKTYGRKDREDTPEDTLDRRANDGAVVFIIAHNACIGIDLRGLVNRGKIALRKAIDLERIDQNDHCAQKGDGSEKSRQTEQRPSFSFHV